MLSPPSHAEAAPPGRLLVVYAIALVGLIAAGYGDIVHAFFVADDFNVLGVVAPAQSAWFATGIEAGWEFFRPLTAVTFWWTFKAFGAEPAAFHVTDLVLHAANAWLVAWLCWQLGRHATGAALAGLAFAAFPTHPEAVTWIAGRFDVLCVTGLLLACNGWVQFVRRGRRLRSLVLACFGLVVGLLAKDTGMIIPVLLFAVGTGPRPTKPSGSRTIGVRLAVVVITVIFAAYLVGRFAILGGFGGYQGEAGSAHLEVNVLRALKFCWAASSNMVAPGASYWAGAACLILVALQAAHSVEFLRRHWMVVVCFGLALAPAANFVILDPITGENARFLYLPAVFFCTGLGLGFGMGTARRDLLGIVALALLATYTVALRATNRTWRTAGDTAATIVSEVRRHNQPPGRHRYLFVHGLPDNHRGAFVFRNGFETAVRMFVAADLEFPGHGRISRADWERFAAARRADPSAHPQILMLRWDPASGRMISPK